MSDFQEAFCNHCQEIRLCAACDSEYAAELCPRSGETRRYEPHPSPNEL